MIDPNTSPDDHGGDRLTVAELVDAGVPDPRLADRVRKILAEAGAAAGMPVDASPAAEAGAIRETVMGVVAELTTDELVAMLDHFNRFDGTPSMASPLESWVEEAAITASAQTDREQLGRASRAYEDHFGFPPVVRAEGRSATDVAAILSAAITTTAAQELARVRSDVSAILDARMLRAASARRD